MIWLFYNIPERCLALLCGFSMCAYPDHRLGGTFIERNPPPPPPPRRARLATTIVVNICGHVISKASHQVMTISPTYLITVEDEHLSAKQPSKSLDRLCLPRPSGTVGVSSQPHKHALRQRQVALVSERGVDQLGGVALVLVGVGKLSIHHVDSAQTLSSMKLKIIIRGKIHGVSEDCLLSKIILYRV